MWIEYFTKPIHKSIQAIRTERKSSFTLEMRPEQEEAVNKIFAYFESFKKENKDRHHTFLWNAKMRFGKPLQVIIGKKNGLEKYGSNF